jgi:hypothetical protein
LTHQTFGRGVEEEEVLSKKVKQAIYDMEYGQTPGNFDANLVNETDRLENCYHELEVKLKNWFSHLI